MTYWRRMLGVQGSMRNWGFNHYMRWSMWCVKSVLNTARLCTRRVLVHTSNEVWDAWMMPWTRQPTTTRCKRSKCSFVHIYCSLKHPSVGAISTFFVFHDSLGARLSFPLGLFLLFRANIINQQREHCVEANTRKWSLRNLERFVLDSMWSPLKVRSLCLRGCFWGSWGFFH